MTAPYARPPSPLAATFTPGTEKKRPRYFPCRSTPRHLRDYLARMPVDYRARSQAGLALASKLDEKYRPIFEKYVKPAERAAIAESEVMAPFQEICRRHGVARQFCKHNLPLTP